MKYTDALLSFGLLLSAHSLFGESCPIAESPVLSDMEERLPPREPLLTVKTISDSHYTRFLENLFNGYAVPRTASSIYESKRSASIRIDRGPDGESAYLLMSGKKIKLRHEETSELSFLFDDEAVPSQQMTGNINESYRIAEISYSSLMCQPPRWILSFAD